VNQPIIYGGIPSSTLWHGRKTISYQFDNIGYQEEIESRDTAKELSVKLGVSIAMADGSLDKKEGTLIKEWIEKSIASYTDPEKIKYKELFNNAFRDAFKLSKSGNLFYTDIAEEIGHLELIDCEYEALDLCYKVMAADGVIDPGETKAINGIIDIFNLEKKDAEKIRDRNILGINQPNLSANDLLQTLNIDSGSDPTTIKKKLSTEFQKWNNRLNIVSADERNEVQTMLDRIALARREYD